MRKTPATPAPMNIPERDGLTDAVQALGQEVQVLREVLDELREEYSWVTRNGHQVQTIEYVVVHQMARDPCAKDWEDRLKVEHFQFTPKASATAGLDALNDIVARFEGICNGIAEAQLEVVLMALDGVREQIITAMRTPSRQGTATMLPNADTIPDDPHVASQEIPKVVEPPPGHLF